MDERTLIARVLAGDAAAERALYDACVRARAMFWLGQSGDPRALALFEEVLSRSAWS